MPHGGEGDNAMNKGKFLEAIKTINNALIESETDPDKELFVIIGDSGEGGVSITFAAEATTSLTAQALIGVFEEHPELAHNVLSTLLAGVAAQTQRGASDVCH